MLCGINGDLGEKYHPLYFLGALGPGGLGVAFYMYLHFMVDHPGSPFATADYVYELVKKWNTVSYLILIDFAIIIYLFYLHFRLLIWNVIEYLNFKKTPAYEKLRNSNAEVSIMAAPLTFAMTINVLFVSGALFTPGLWDIVEYLFPFSILAFFICGVYALVIYVQYITRIMSQPSFDFSKNNNLSQLVAPFAFSMVAVGFSAPGAMSHNLTTSSIGLFLAIFFLAITIALTLIILNYGFKSMMEVGIAEDGGASLWVIIPILTLIGITIYRCSFGFIHNFGSPNSKSYFFILTSSIESLQIIFIIIGIAIMINIDYFPKIIFGTSKNPNQFALLCPGVAFFVFGTFFIHGGLVNGKVFERFSIPYFIILGIFTIVQIATGYFMFHLNNKILNDDEDDGQVQP